MEDCSEFELPIKKCEKLEGISISIYYWIEKRQFHIAEKYCQKLLIELNQIIKENGKDQSETIQR